MSSAVTVKLCSRFESTKAIGAPLGCVQRLSQWMTNWILNAPSASVTTGAAPRGTSRSSSSLGLMNSASASVKSKWGRTETRTVRFESTPAQNGCRRDSRFECHR
jgi:hypothetical protein